MKLYQTLIIIGFLFILLQSSFSDVTSIIDLSNMTMRDKDLVFSAITNGMVNTKLHNPKENISVGFMMMGKKGNRDFSVSSLVFDWTWKIDIYNVTRKRINLTRLNNDEIIKPVLNITDRYFDNITFTLTNITGTANNTDVIIKQVWSIDPEQVPKVKYEIKNIMLKDITNFTFWYIIDFSYSPRIRFDGNSYEHLDTGITWEFGSFENVIPIIDMGQLEFRYHDLIENGFNVTDFYTGDGALLGYVNKTIVALGITTQSGILASGKTLTLDPTVTDWKSPTRTGQFYDQWDLGSEVISQDFVYASTSMNNLRQGTDLYGLDSIPSTVVITGVEVRVYGMVNPPLS